MTTKNKLSAQVIVRAASGKKASADVTSENIQEYLPSAEALSKAQSSFSELGFDVEHGYGNSFSITGSRAAFEKAFKTKFEETEKGGIKSAETGSIELPIEHFPERIKKVVEAVTFTEPPDYGPTNF